MIKFISKIKAWLKKVKMKLSLLSVVCFSVFSITGCEDLFKDSGKLMEDVFVVEHDIEKIKEDF